MLRPRGQNEMGACGLMQERQPHHVDSGSPQGGFYILFYEDEKPLEGAAVMDIGKDALLMAGVWAGETQESPPATSQGFPPAWPAPLTARQGLRPSPAAHGASAPALTDTRMHSHPWVLPLAFGAAA